LRAGSNDNLTVQVTHIDKLADVKLSEVQDKISTLPLPPISAPRMKFEDYKIQSKLYSRGRGMCI
jgi:hypothetical protein